MPRLPDQPHLEWKDEGTPVATGFDDVYFSTSDGLAETRAVFLAPCGLPERWRNQPHFTIAELGFGTGLNFLAATALWRSDQSQASGWLHFLSVEKFPLSRADAARALSGWKDIDTSLLLDRWPERTAGLQRIVFPEWRCTLTLYVGDAADWLTEYDFLADAWFLDGFSPSKNDKMWSNVILSGVGRHAAPGCKVGTFTVAGHVRRGLSAAGFEVSKQPGFGRKRERLEAEYTSTVFEKTSDLYLVSPKPVIPSNICIIGAGIAGAAVARQFAERGYLVDVLDSASNPASAASGNPRALIMPRLDAADTPQARFLIQSYLYALKYYLDRVPEAAQQTDVSHYPQTEAEDLRFAKLLADPPLDLNWLGAGDGSRAGLIHYGSLMIDPPTLVKGLLDHPKIIFQGNRNIDDLADLQASYPSETVFVVASGMGMTKLLPEMGRLVEGKLGQVELGQLNNADSGSESCASGTYALRRGNELLFGATFEKTDLDAITDTSSTARDENLAGLKKLAPHWLDELEIETLSSRASVRATTADRFPIAGVAFDAGSSADVLKPLANGAKVEGKVPYRSGVFCIGGLGSRGFTFAPLLADHIVSMALGEPLPLARQEAELVSPIRFLIRAIRKRKL